MIILSSTFKGGAGLTPKRGQTAPNTLARALRDIADDLTALKNPGLGTLRTGGVVPYPLLADPSTPSTQASGVGNTAWRVNVAACECIVGGIKKVFTAQADFSIHAGSFLAGFVNGDSCIAAIVAQNNAGTVTCVAVKGTPAVTGTQVAPTDAQIQAAIGATFPWVKVGECLLSRTADTVVAESQDSVPMEIYLGRAATLLTIKG